MTWYCQPQRYGEDSTSPYAYTWNNTATGTYAMIVRAIDNSSAIPAAGINIRITGRGAGKWNWLDSFVEVAYFGEIMSIIYLNVFMIVYYWIRSETGFEIYNPDKIRRFFVLNRNIIGGR